MEASGSFSIFDLGVVMDDVITRLPPRGWSHGWFMRPDWSQLKTTASPPVYQWTDRKDIKGSMRAFNVTFENGTNHPQQFQLSETLLSSNRCLIQINGGVQSGAAPLPLRLPKDLAGRGLPAEVILKGSDSTVGEEITWRVNSSVTVPEKSTVTASLSGDEQHFQGTFEQKIRMTGKAVAKVFNREGTFQRSLEYPIDELLRESRVDQTGMSLAPQQVEMTLRGSCQFYVSTNNRVRVQ